MFCKCENIQKLILVNIFRVRCCRSVLTFWNRLWIRSWCLTSEWVIKVLLKDICCFYFKRNSDSPSFLPLLLCVQRKRTAHERAKDLFASGEFSSGRKWADDAPKEKLDSNTVNLIASGACGAFVHGLEDEMFGTWNTVPRWRFLIYRKISEDNFLTSPFFLWYHALWFESFYCYFRGPYCSSGGALQARSVVCELRWKVFGLPGRHVQRRDRGSEAAVHPRAERNLHTYNTQRGPAGHGAGCVRGEFTFTFSIQTLMAVDAMQGADRHIRSSFGVQYLA